MGWYILKYLLDELLVESTELLLGCWIGRQQLPKYTHTFTPQPPSTNLPADSCGRGTSLGTRSSPRCLFDLGAIISEKLRDGIRPSWCLQIMRNGGTCCAHHVLLLHGGVVILVGQDLLLQFIFFSIVVLHLSPLGSCLWGRINYSSYTHERRRVGLQYSHLLEI